MTTEDGAETVRKYYRAYREDTPEAVSAALTVVLSPTFTLESPLVEDLFGGPVTGPAAIAVAEQAAPALRNAVLDALYSRDDGAGVVALIHFPIPGGVIVQSEHFDIDLRSRTIDRLRSYYDPRRLLPPPPVPEG